jgi:hypothetical protein
MAEDTKNTGTAQAHDPKLEREVMKLLDESNTMSKEEKESWISLMPIMNDEQVTELKRILATEKEKLAEIDKKYKSQVKKLEKEYIENYLSRKSRKKWEDAREREKSQLEESTEEAEELLSKL